MARVTDLQEELSRTKKEMCALDREMGVLRKGKNELEEHVERLIREREELHKKVTHAESLSAANEENKDEIERHKNKLKWYAENQRLLDKDTACLRGKDEEIEQLKARLEQVGSESGQRIQENKTWKKDKARGLKKIQDLERQVKEMELILKRRHPNSVATLLMAAAALPNSTNEKTPSTTVLEERIGKLETELSQKDEEANRQLRAVEQKYNTVKLRYEEEIRRLEEQVAGRIADPHHPHTHGLALARELESTKARHEGEMGTLRAEVQRLRHLLDQSHTKGASLEEYERCRVEARDKEERIKLLEVQLMGKEVHPSHPQLETQEIQRLKAASGRDETLKLVTEENQRLQIKVDHLGLEMDQQRVSLQKSLAEAEVNTRMTKELYEAKIEDMRVSHQRDTQRLLTEHLSQHSGSKIGEIQAKLETQEVLVKHLKEQLSQQQASSGQLSDLKQQEALLKCELARVRDDLIEAKCHHTPAMRQFEALREKIVNLERRHKERESEIREAVTNTRRAVREEMAEEVRGWERVVQEKSEEIVKFRREMDAILEVLRVLKLQGVVLSV